MSEDVVHMQLCFGLPTTLSDVKAQVHQKLLSAHTCGSLHRHRAVSSHLQQTPRHRLQPAAAASADIPAAPAARAPLSALPEPSGEWSSGIKVLEALLPWSETNEFKRDHLAWAHKRCAALAWCWGRSALWEGPGLDTARLSFVCPSSSVQHEPGRWRNLY